MKQLSNKESKYRNKIIAENHLKKECQIYLDNYVKTQSLTYKHLYLNYGLLYGILVKYSFSKLSGAMKNVGASCVNAANAFQKLAASLVSFDDYQQSKQFINT